MNSQDAAGNLTTSKDYTFTTDAEGGLSIWIIIGPIIGVLAIALAAYFIVMRRRYENWMI